jgi:proteasome lid subunit RPN8/RPN11
MVRRPGKRLRRPGGDNYLSQIKREGRLRRLHIVIVQDGPINIGTSWTITRPTRSASHC